MPPSVARALLCASALALMANGFRTLVALVSSAQAGDWLLTQRGGLFQFLTICGLAVASLTTVLAFVHALAPAYQIVGDVKCALGLVALPTALIVAEVYWPLILLAPSLIAQVDTGTGADGTPPPAAFMYPLPLRLDLALHAAPVIALLVDFFCFEHKYSRRQLVHSGLPAAALTGLTYAGWVEYCASGNGTFPYPFLNAPIYIRVIIYALASTIAYLSFCLVNSLHPVAHPSESKSKWYYDDDEAWPDIGPWVWFHRVKL